MNILWHCGLSANKPSFFRFNVVLVQLVFSFSVHSFIVCTTLNFITLHLILFSTSNDFYRNTIERKAKIGHTCACVCDAKSGSVLKSTFSCFKVHVSLVLIRTMNWPIDFGSHSVNEKKKKSVKIFDGPLCRRWTMAVSIPKNRLSGNTERMNKRKEKGK